MTFGLEANYSAIALPFGGLFKAGGAKAAGGFFGRLFVKKETANFFQRLESLSGKRAVRHIQQIIDSMKKNGWQGNPVVVFEHNGTKYLLDGHHRVEAARRLGIQVEYRTILKADLPKYNYKNVDEVINAASYLKSNRLR